jgi:hypothetical protein
MTGIALRGSPADARVADPFGVTVTGELAVGIGDTVVFVEALCVTVGADPEHPDSALAAANTAQPSASRANFPSITNTPKRRIGHRRRRSRRYPASRRDRPLRMLYVMPLRADYFR